MKEARAHIIYFHLYALLDCVLIEIRAVIFYREGIWIIKDYKKTLWGDENVLCIEWGGNYISVYLCQNLPNTIHLISASLEVNYSLL